MVLVPVAEICFPALRCELSARGSLAPLCSQMPDVRLHAAPQSSSALLPTLVAAQKPLPNWFPTLIGAAILLNALAHSPASISHAAPLEPAPSPSTQPEATRGIVWRGAKDGRSVRFVPLVPLFAGAAYRSGVYVFLQLAPAFRNLGALDFCWR